MIHDLAKRILFGIGLGRVSAASDETGAVQKLQLVHRTGETHDAVPSVQLYGFASVPLVGCDKVVVYGEGDRSKGVAVASNDQRYRPKNMAGGEVQVHDNAGQQIYLKAGTAIVINAMTEVDVQINGALILKVTSSGVAVTGNITATGDITGGYGGSDSIDMQHHTHTYLPGDGSPTATSGPIAGT